MIFFWCFILDSEVLVSQTRKEDTDDGVQNSARKIITFAQQEEHTIASDIQWPTATLLTTVSDPQVSNHRIPTSLVCQSSHTV